MKYFLTGVTGSLGGYIFRDIIIKDPDAHFFLPIRQLFHSASIEARFLKAINELGFTESESNSLLNRVTLLELNVQQSDLGFTEDELIKITQETDKFIHAAASIRFDEPYKKAHVSNFVFTEKVFEIFERAKKTQPQNKSLIYYYVSSAFVAGIHKGLVSEHIPKNKYNAPNTYVKTKAEAKWYLKSKKKEFDIVIFEPSIIGGDSQNGYLKFFGMHYDIIKLKIGGKLPYFTAPNSNIDIVPINWVSGIITDVVVGNKLRKGTIRLAYGKNSITIKEFKKQINYYLNKKGLNGNLKPTVMIPKWLFYLLLNGFRFYTKVLYAITKNPNFKYLHRQTKVIMLYYPYFTTKYEFDMDESLSLIEEYSNFGQAPSLKFLYEDEIDEKSRKYFYNIMDFFISKQGHFLTKQK